MICTILKQCIHYSSLIKNLQGKTTGTLVPTNGEEMEEEMERKEHIQATDRRACVEQNRHFASQATLFSKK